MFLSHNHSFVHLTLIKNLLAAWPSSRAGLTTELVKWWELR